MSATVLYFSHFRRTWLPSVAGTLAWSNHKAGQKELLFQSFYRVHWAGLTAEWSRHGGSHVGQKHAWEKIVLNFSFSLTVNSNKHDVLTTLSSTSLMTKKKTVKTSKIWVKFFTIGCVFYRVGDWDDLQIDPYVSNHDGFKTQFAGIVPVFLEFNGRSKLPSTGGYLCFTSCPSKWLGVSIPDTEIEFTVEAKAPSLSPFSKGKWRWVHLLSVNKYKYASNHDAIANLERLLLIIVRLLSYLQNASFVSWFVRFCWNFHRYTSCVLFKPKYVGFKRRKPPKIPR